MQALRKLGHSYAHLTHTRPYLTKGLTSGGLLGAGDAICQVDERHVADRDGGAAAPPWDAERVARMFVWGLLCNGPSGHAWYLGLDKVVPQQGAKALVTKIAADQLIYTPPLTLLYFVWQHALQQRELGWSAVSSAWERVWPTLQVNWTYWTLVHIITFTWIPLEYRVAFVSLKNFFWGGYLSYAAARKPAATGKGGQEGGHRLTRTLSRGAGVYLQVDSTTLSTTSRQR